MLHAIASRARGYLDEKLQPIVDQFMTQYQAPRL